MCIVEIKTADNRKLTCFVSCSRQVASSGEANCSGVIRTRRSTVISPNSTCRKSTCKRKKKESCSPQRIACGGERGVGRVGGGGEDRDDTVVRACDWVWVPVVYYTAVFSVVTQRSSWEEHCVTTVKQTRVREAKPFLDWLCCWFSSLGVVSRKSRWLSRPEIKHSNKNLKNNDMVLSQQTRSFCFA